MFGGLQMYILANAQGLPVLVKYGDGVCYLPVFENRSAATEAAINLVGTADPALIKNEQVYFPTLFSWSAYRTWRNQHLENGHTLFVYPMSPEDYGAKKK